MTSGTIAGPAVDPNAHSCAGPGKAVRPADRGLVVALACLSSSLVWVATAYGPGITPDSVTYLSAGLEWSRSGRPVVFDGVELSLFPPGLPAVIAGFDIVGLDAVAGMRVLNAVCSAALVVISYWLSRWVLGGRWTPLGIAGVVAVSPSILTTYLGLWSDGLFVVVVLAVLLILVRAGMRGSISAWLYAALAVLSMLAVSLRWSGVVLAPVCALTFLYLTPSTQRWGSRLWRSAIVGLLAAAPFVALVAYQHLRGLPVMGVRLPPTHSPREVVADIVATHTYWATGVSAPSIGMAMTGVVLLLLAIVGAVHGATTAAQQPVFVPLLLWCGCYWALVVSSELTTAIDGVAEFGGRLGVPVFVPTMILAAHGLRVVLRVQRQIIQRVVVAGCVSSVVITTLVTSTGTAIHVKSTGFGIDSERLAETYGTTLRGTLAGQQLVVADMPWLVWWLARPARVVPAPLIFYHVRGSAPQRSQAIADQVGEYGSATMILAVAGQRAATVGLLRQQGLAVERTGTPEDLVTYQLSVSAS